MVYDNLVKGHRWAAKWRPLVAGDILDRPCLDDALPEHTPAAVMHFAAYSDVGESIVDPVIHQCLWPTPNWLTLHWTGPPVA
jgi:UDP-glucose 4-epimerase